MRAAEDARRAFVDGAAALNRPPYTQELVAEAILSAAIALIRLAELDHEDKAKDLVITALRVERDRRFPKVSPSAWTGTTETK